MLTLYDAARCPYCARVRIVLAEKSVEYEPVEIDLDNRPAWIYDKNPAGKVPVLEENGFELPESAVIMEYLEEKRPEPPLLPPEVQARARARVWIDRFDARLGNVYYAVRRREATLGELEHKLYALERALTVQPYLTGWEFGLADIAYVPWIFRSRALLGIDLDRFEALFEWLGRLAERPPVAAEIDVVAALAR